MEIDLRFLFVFILSEQWEKVFFITISVRSLLLGFFLCFFKNVLVK